MADENVDLRFIGEQLARVLQELGEVRKEQHQMRTEQHEMRNELLQARQELAQVHNVQNEIAVEVAVLGGNVRDVKETLNIIEHDISAMKLRIERIERHTGLVKT